MVPLWKNLPLWAKIVLFPILLSSMVTLAAIAFSVLVAAAGIVGIVVKRINQPVKSFVSRIKGWFTKSKKDNVTIITPSGATYEHPAQA